MQLRFQAWRKFEAKKNPQVIRRFLVDVGEEAVSIFKKGMSGSHSGRMYSGHQASAPGEYPANRTGKLSRSIKSRATANQVVIGSNKFYSKFLRGGTSKMARRKMSDNALEEAMKIARMRGRWVEWEK